MHSGYSRAYKQSGKTCNGRRIRIYGISALFVYAVARDRFYSKAEIARGSENRSRHLRDSFFHVRNFAACNFACLPR